MWCSVLQCVAVCCSVWQCVATCCSVLQCVAVCYRVLHVEVLNPEVKGREAILEVCCSVLQCVAVCCMSKVPISTSRAVRLFSWCVAVCCSVLQCVAVCCSMLPLCCCVSQCVVVCSSRLQYVAGRDSESRCQGPQEYFQGFWKFPKSQLIHSIILLEKLCRALTFEKFFLFFFNFSMCTSATSRLESTLQHTATHCNTLQHTGHAYPYKSHT